jgi:hypothetical protein
MKLIAAAAIAFIFCASAEAQSITRAREPEVIGSYTAYISQEDLHNSSGARLSQPWQIIRQDRANYHAYGIRDRGDEDDSFFLDKTNRENLEAMLANGSMSRDAQLMILQGNCWVNVQIYGHGNTGSFLEVEVWK